MRTSSITETQRKPDDYLARLIAREARRDRTWFAVQLIGLWLAAAVILGFKELQHGIVALPVYIAEMVFFTAVTLIAWHREK